VHNEELIALLTKYDSGDKITKRQERLARHVAYSGEKRNACRILEELE
jgi:hypothetical protein